LFGHVEPDPDGPNPYTECKADEFKEFFRRFGIAQTAMSHPIKPAQTRVLAKAPAGNNIYAAEFIGKLFLLPFKKISDLKELSELLTLVIRSILTYKRRNNFYLPDWVDHIKFKREDENSARLDQLKAEISELDEEQQRLRAHKGILVASGYPLVDTVVATLREYFGLKVERVEDFIEDAKIYDPAGILRFVVEIKGVSGGLKRDHIGQVDSHRERLNLDKSTMGLLILNDFADTEGLEERRSKQMSQGQLDLATYQNVKVLRTVALIDLMLALEDAPNRAEAFLKRCEAGDPLVTVA
jgi:hypothetical protein